uniref:Preprotein-translocase subunit g n=1 Tax=Bornetia secundiflora TaxID=2575637 RepID=A0A4D6WQQ0_9FLOR|nr:Preprotein-translocase subunit g [Bornetia secundiflora]
MIKLMWYIASMLTILLILMNNPNSNVNNFMGSNPLLNFRGNQIIIVRLTICSIFLFIIFTVLSVNLFFF